MRSEVEINPKTWGGSTRRRKIRSCGDCEHFSMSPQGKMWCDAFDVVLPDPFVAIDCQWYDPW